MANADAAVEPETEGQKGSASRKKKHVGYYLPQELVSDILLRIPAQGLHDIMRHVCREWDLLIRTQDFAYSNLRNSAGGFLMEQTYAADNVVYVEMRGERVEISEFYCRFEGPVLNSCNGLILTHGPGDFEIPFLINPLTKQRATLPPYDDHETESWAYFAIAFVEASMEYKVVCSHDDIDQGQASVAITVLTIGVDRVWRDICVEHLTPGKREALLGEPLVTGCYMHWIRSSFLMTLNVETETFYQFPLPRSLRRRFTDFHPMGSKLSGVDQSRKFSTYIWEMNPENGEWTMLHCIDLKPLSRFLKDLFHEAENPLSALGWLVASEVLVFETINGRCIAYNVKTKEILPLELTSNIGNSFILPHVNSLVWFE